MTNNEEFENLEANEALLSSLLSDPEIWDEPRDGLEDGIVAAILAESGFEADAQTDSRVDTEAEGAAEQEPEQTEQLAPVVPISAAKRWFQPIAAGVAAALLVLGGFAIFGRTSEPAADIEVVMEGTDLAPDASADLSIDTTPLGTRLILDISDLPPAPEGKVYEAWLRTGPEVGVSAGTFHMRGGDGEIELWAGVLIDDYPLVTITIQDEAADLSSGQVVLKALVEIEE